MATKEGKSNTIDSSWALVPIGSSNPQIESSLAYGCSMGSCSTSELDGTRLVCNPDTSRAIFQRPIRTLCLYDILDQNSNDDKLSNPPFLIGTDHGDILSITDHEINAFRLTCVDQIGNKTSWLEPENLHKHEKKDTLTPSYRSIIGLQVFDRADVSRSATSESYKDSPRKTGGGGFIAILPQPSNSIFVTVILPRFNPQALPIPTFKLPEHGNNATILSLSCSRRPILCETETSSARQHNLSLLHLLLTSDDKGWVRVSSFSNCIMNDDNYRNTKKGLEEKFINEINNLDSFPYIQEKAHSGQCTAATFIKENDVNVNGPSGSLVRKFATAGGERDATIRIWKVTCMVVTTDVGLAPSISLSISPMILLNAPDTCDGMSVLCPILNDLNGVKLCVGTSSGTLLLWGVPADQRHHSVMKHEEEEEEKSWELLSALKHTNQPITCALACSPDHAFPGLLLTGDYRGTCRLYRASPMHTLSKVVPLQLVAEVTLRGPCCTMARSANRSWNCSSNPLGYMILVASEIGEIKRWHESGLPLTCPILAGLKSAESSTLLQTNPSLNGDGLQHETHTDHGDTSTHHQERNDHVLSSGMDTISSVLVVSESGNASTCALSNVPEVDDKSDLMVPRQSLDKDSLGCSSIQKCFSNNKTYDECDKIPNMSQNGTCNEQLPSRARHTNPNPKREPRKRELFVPTPALPPERPHGLSYTSSSISQVIPTMMGNIAQPSNPAGADCNVNSDQPLVGSETIRHPLLPPDPAGISVTRNSRCSSLTQKQDKELCSRRQPTLTPHPLTRPSSNSILAALQVELLDEASFNEKKRVDTNAQKIISLRSRQSCLSRSKEFNCLQRQDPLIHQNLVPGSKAKKPSPSRKIKKQVSKVRTETSFLSQSHFIM